MSTRIAEVEAELRLLERRRHDLLVELDALRRETVREPQLPLSNVVPRTPSEKVALFLALFGARRSVFPQLWVNPKTGQKGYSPACQNEWVKGVCEKGHGVKCSACIHQAFPPLDAAAVEDHLTGRRTIGAYAIREDNSCIFLAADFDGSGSLQDASAYRQAALEFGVHTAVERSRSGVGTHAWIFFAQPVPAEAARRLGTIIVAKASARHAGMKLSTYDRFFPNQDTIPAAGFGNLIALPLQKIPRAIGNTLFLDEDMNPYADQWDYLASIRRVTLEELQKLVALLRPSMVEAETSEPDAFSLRCDEGALDLIPKAVTKGVFQGVLTVILGAQLQIATTGLPVCLVAAFKRLGTLPNPAFYEKQRLRFPTYNIPRFIFCGELHENRLVLPRGTLSGVLELVRKAGGRAEIEDIRVRAKGASFTFSGSLSDIQQVAVDAILPHDGGVLVAPPGAGKTVMGCALIAARNIPTLILVHRKPLMEQWRERCAEFLGVAPKEIHILGQARNRQAPLAIGMLQTLARSDSAADLFAGYGQVIIDECHHLPAASFEAVLKQCPMRFIVGLTATPSRKDGLQKILFLQCGSIRHRIDLDRGTDLARRVIVREFSLRVPPEESRMPIHELWAMLATSEARNRMIARDVIGSLAQNRCAAVLSDRKEHLLTLESLLHQGVQNAADTVFRIDGSMPRKERAAIFNKLKGTEAERRPFAILATSSLLGEGFDLPILDTLFLTMPISFKGRVIQYAGRLHRTAKGKTDALIYDYVEADHPLMAHMHRKRMKTLQQLGYQIE